MSDSVYETELCAHVILDELVTFAILKDSTDDYQLGLRERPIDHVFSKYILHKASLIQRPLKFVDGGANIGTVSLPLAKRGFPVLAIEMLPENIACLFAAIVANNLSNFTVAAMALYERPSFIHFHRHGAYGGIDPTNQAVSGSYCYADTLANIMKIYNFADADVVKLDIEGAELSALSGIEAICTNNPDLEFIYESNSYASDEFGYSSQKLIERFENLGYHNYAFRGDGLYSINSGEVQPQILEDILASRKPASDMMAAGLSVNKFALREIVTELEKQALSSNRHQQQHVARQLKFIPNGNQFQQRVVAIRSHLKTLQDSKIDFELADDNI